MNNPLSFQMNLITYNGNFVVLFFEKFRDAINIFEVEKKFLRKTCVFILFTFIQTIFLLDNIVFDKFEKVVKSEPKIRI